MSGRAARRKGSQWERDVVAFLRSAGLVNAERAYGAGRPDDVGDIDGLPGVVVEAKNCARLEFGPWLDEAERERANAGAQFGIVVAKRRQRPVGEAFAVMTLEQLARLLAERDALEV
jgi:hypothetical protein